MNNNNRTNNLTKMKMRKLKVLSLMVLICGSVLGQDNKIESKGKVGIGTENPAALLQVKDELNYLTKQNTLIHIQSKMPSIWNKNISPAIEFASNIGLAKIVGIDLRGSNSDMYKGGLVFKTRRHVDGDDKGYFERMRICDDGNVGIGTSSPDAKLEVYQGDIAIKGSANDAGDLIFRNGSSGQLGRIYTNNSGKSGLHLTSGDNHADLSIDQYGKVGIGTNSPIEKFTLNYGNILVNNPSNIEGFGNGTKITICNSHTGTFGKHSSLVFSNSSDGSSALAGVSGLYDTWTPTNGAGMRMVFYTKDAGTESKATEKMVITGEGNVGIGITNPDSYKLAVEGVIGAHEIKVTTDGWADFVFDDNYQLQDLQEVEAYIKENNHLPNIPSEQEVLENGIALGEMDAKLLRKIEEFTLYAIQQRQEVQSQKFKVEKVGGAFS